MDLSPVYELQERLRTAIIAGANLLNEDFRLKRAAEAIKPFASASPVFAKLCQQMELLLSPGCSTPAGVLLDTISLADAVICTLGTVEVKTETTDVELPLSFHPEKYTENNPYIFNVPYSQVKTLINALTTTGSGNYSTVNDMLQTYPDIFKDYRVRYALVCALGAPYYELVNLARNYLSQCSTEIIPILKKDFDPKGKKEMVHRINIITEIAGASENSFYLEMLETATGDVRTALITALGYEPANFERLLSMAKTERGKNKQCVLNILARMESVEESEELYNLFKQTIKKNLPSALIALMPSTTVCASRVIAEECMEQLPKIIAAIEKDNASEIQKKLTPFCRLVEALPGKHGDEVYMCYKQLLLESKTLDQGSLNPSLEVIDYMAGNYSTIHSRNTSFQLFNRQNFPPKTDRKLTWELITGSHIAQSLVIFPGSQSRQMAMEFFESSGNSINFLAAAAFVKILESDNCTEWFDGQIKKNPYAMVEIQRALSYIKWDSQLNSYITSMLFSDIEWEDSRKFILNKIEIPDASRIQDWMMEQGSHPEDSRLIIAKTGLKKREAKHNMQYMDEILNRWINTADQEQCEKAGSYFYNRALSIQDNTDYLAYMLNCRWTECKGLATRFAKNKQKIQMWELTDYLYHLPGNARTIQKIQKEVDAVIEIIKSGGLKPTNFNLGTEQAQKWFDSLKNPANYICVNLDK